MRARAPARGLDRRSGAPDAADAAERVTIDRAKFDPAVVVVTSGTEVEWRNEAGRPRALRGDVSSPVILPGGVFRRRFDRIGRFDYRDRGNPALTGTVVVQLYGGRRPRYPRPGGPDRLVRDAEIAARLVISRHTVNQHLKSVYAKLGISRRLELTRMCRPGSLG